MPSSSSFSTRTLVAIAAVLVLLGGFWLLVIGPKRKEADKLATELDQQGQVLSEAQAKVTEGLIDKRSFPSDYRQLVVLGKAVPESDETASLLVLLNRISTNAHVSFNSLSLESGSESAAATATAPEASPTSAPKPSPPTEAEASLLPLGATVGTANLGVMPYSLKFTGSFFQIADFIHGIERQIKTDGNGVNARGRLITLDGFSLTRDSEAGFPYLTAEFGVTAYVTPPSELGEALPGAGGLPTGEEAAPAAAATTTGSPSSYTTGEAR